MLSAEIGQVIAPSRPLHVLIIQPPVLLRQAHPHPPRHIRLLTHLTKLLLLTLEYPDNPIKLFLLALSYSSEVANLLLMTLLLTSDHPSEVSNLLIMMLLLTLNLLIMTLKLTLSRPRQLREYPIRLLQTRKPLFSRHRQHSFPLPNHTTSPYYPLTTNHYPLSYISPNLRLYSN